MEALIFAIPLFLFAYVFNPLVIGYIHFFLIKWIASWKNVMSIIFIITLILTLDLHYMYILIVGNFFSSEPVAWPAFPVIFALGCASYFYRDKIKKILIHFGSSPLMSITIAILSGVQVILFANLLQTDRITETDFPPVIHYYFVSGPWLIAFMFIVMMLVLFAFKYLYQPPQNIRLQRTIMLGILTIGVTTTIFAANMLHTRITKELSAFSLYFSEPTSDAVRITNSNMQSSPKRSFYNADHSFEITEENYDGDFICQYHEVVNCQEVGIIYYKDANGVPIYASSDHEIIAIINHETEVVMTKTSNSQTTKQEMIEYLTRFRKMSEPEIQP